jgi:hypothetical protein
MSKKHKSAALRKAGAVKSSPAPSAQGFDKWRKYLPAILIFTVSICYWTPLTSPNASIQWDAADEFQPGQQYLSDELYAGHLPFWTPYIWAGFPFLADPQLGAWYPLNWPFLLIGPTVHVFEAENLLHAFLACFGAYLLAKKLFGNTAAALFAGLSYGLSGFFAAHSSHTPMFQAAAWLPWLLLLFARALEGRAWRNGALAALVAGMIVLAGHFQTALYCFAALALFALAQLLTQPLKWRRALPLAVLVPLSGACLSAVAVLPGLELASHSIRAAVSAVGHREGFLTAGSLATLFYPNFYGVISGNYSGPVDITQYYFYSGILLLPLAALGLRDRVARWAGTCLIVPCLWYGAGYALGLYYLVARLPGFRSIRAPVHIFFVASLGLSLLAAAGFAWVTTRWRRQWLPLLLLGITAVDLWYWNSDRNPLAYARFRYEDTYGAGEKLFERAVAGSMAPLSRFEAPERLQAFGPLDHPLEARVETTYGYNPLMLSRYADYSQAMRVNPKLKNGLNVLRMLDMRRRAVVPNPGGLSRVTVPPKLVAVSSDAASRSQLSTLDPARQALAPASLAALHQDQQATAQVVDYSGSSYRIHYRSSTETLLRISAAFFPGWRARVDGQAREVHPIDHALMGVVVPPGERDLTLEYHSTYFAAGVVGSLLTLLACVAAIATQPRFRGFVRPAHEPRNQPL